MADPDPPPDPFGELRVRTLRSVRGINYWAYAPVTRLELAVGAYDEISSADVYGFTDRLLAALPGLWDHRCSVGERGGFVQRLRQGTYAAHVVEHVALELQSCIGHEVGFGRARGGNAPGEYTVVVEHRHTAVGQRAVLLAIDAVQRAFAGTLDGVAAAVDELRALAATRDAPRPRRRVLCGVTGGGARAEVRARILDAGAAPARHVVDLAPATLLDEGLPYRDARVAVVLDAQPDDVPARYREPDAARRLVGIAIDGVAHGGTVVLPAGEVELRRRARDAGCQVAVFDTDAAVPAPQQAAALAVHALRRTDRSEEAADVWTA